MAAPSRPPSTADPTATTCSVCQAPAFGKFCSNCGSPLPGATCAECDAPLTPGAKFCHRCGTPARANAAPAGGTSFANALPWSVAGIALLALIALVAGQRFRSTPAAPPDATAPVSDRSPARQPPDISSLTPAEAAVRLYDRVMGAHERGKDDTVRTFAPMAIAAYQMLGTLDLDQRYDLGRIAALAGEQELARGQADTILAANPNHLLGLILAANAAHLRKDAAAERGFQKRLVAAAPTERTKQLPEYTAHENDITVALDLAKRP